MSKLPAQLPWRDFVKIVEKLGYSQLPNGRGSARSFHNPHANPPTVTFHEPHEKEQLKEGTLREYLRKLHIDRDTFFHLLNSL
jgi:predicted RNA binding protein YcfA (HicA-like mRNA interferase family)